MTRLLPLGLFLPLSFSALAQQPDTLALRREAVPDSLKGLIKDEVIVTHHRLTPFVPLQEQLRQVAGVQASPYSGAPWAPVAVRIRGAASLSANAQPLYVVDGVPVFQNTFQNPANSPSFGFQTAEATELDVNPLLSLPTEDIESVELIKGALGSARYGSQGLNGVISISTRRGAAGPLRVSYSGYGGVQRTRRPYELLDARQYAALANEAAISAGKSAPFSAAQIASLGRGTDWQDEVLRTAAVQEHHLSAQGGQSRSRYYASADYLSNKGVLLGSSLSRYAARAAVEQGIGQKLRLSAQAGISQTEQRLPLHTLLEWALICPPTVPVRNPDGTLTENQLKPNAVRLAEEHYQTPQQRRVLAQAAVQYTLLPGLTAEMRASLEQAVLRSKSYIPAIGTLPRGLRSNHDATYQQWVFTPALRYSRSLQEGRHVIEAEVEAFRQSRTVHEDYEEFGGSSGGAPVLTGTRSSMHKAAIEGYRLEAGYTWAGRYQVQGSLRQDASSTFEPTGKWEWLPGAQLTWHAGQEDFLRGRSAIDRLDVWAGWGRTSARGNIGRNSILIPLANAGNILNLITLFFQEPTEQLEAGATLDLWNNKLQLTTTAYTRRTSSAGLLLSRVLNEGSTVRNRGLELTASSAWQVGSVHAVSSVAAAYNQNRFRRTGFIDYINTYQRTLDNQPLSTFYGARYLGVDGSGGPRFEDKNGDGKIWFDDYQPLGSGLPRQLLSFGQQLSYKRFTLQGRLDGQFGYTVNNQLLYQLDIPSGGTNGTTRLLDRWTPANPNTTIPAANQDFLFPSVSTYALQSGNHLRLTSLTLTCKVWEKEARNFSVWAGGHNLLVLTKYRGFDPNISSAGSDSQQAGIDASTYPTARTVVLGVRATL